MIYIIDDDQYVRRGFKILLRSAGFECKDFENAEDFIKAYSPDNEDFLILDYHLPEMNGCELLAYFKANNIHIPVIIVTAYDDQLSRECAKNYGAVAFLRKPVDGEALIDMIKYTLQEV